MNWILNNNIVLDKEIAKGFGLIENDQVVILVSRLDKCFYILKWKGGANKLCSNRNTKSMTTRNRDAVVRLGIQDGKKVYFDMQQDEYDKKNNSIKCSLRIQEYEI